MPKTISLGWFNLLLLTVALEQLAIGQDQLEPTVPNDADVTPLTQAHAHNDYYHPRPLLDAIDQGFCSVEADIFLVGDQLLVGHSRLELRKDRTLQTLYLDPLRQRVQSHGGRVYADGPTFTLMVDIKSDGPRTYAVLREQLAQYRDMLMHVEQGKVQAGAIQVVVSGNRPIAEMSAEKTRFAGIDGRLGDLDSDRPAHLMPMISDRWSSHFRWRGEGVIPTEEGKKLRTIVEQAHASGRRVRFWATPEKTTVWKELQDAGVDHINTDQLKRLREFLSQKNAGGATVKP